ncbi:MAG: hypothetical protein BRD50_01345 [Bacteroidetes bacterium SW_11_45_7]|nr:MAG: hypothetical protein BRD50_01345 [Bacteroidetes bacterium SW_11_45_7]
MTEFPRKDYIRYRLQRADETLNASHLLLQNNFANSAVNRLYYACFYAVNALLVSEGIKAHTHAGVKTQLFLHFVKTNRLSSDSGKLYAKLFTARQRTDYDDFYDFDRQTVATLYDQSEAFIKEIKHLMGFQE